MVGKMYSGADGGCLADPESARKKSLANLFLTMRNPVGGPVEKLAVAPVDFTDALALGN